MILKALADYYDRLEADPSSDVAAFGFSRQKIGFQVVLEKDGKLHEVQKIGTKVGQRDVPESLVVPGQAKPSGSGINPCFLWDNAQYMLGFKADDPKPERTQEAFDAFRDRHLAEESEVDDAAFSTVCRFLRAWDPARAAEIKDLEEKTSSFGVFRIRGEDAYVHQREKVLAYWHRQLNSAPADDTPMAPSLISGLVQPIARLHEPKIKGVYGGQSSGATLVSFNADAYESFGKVKSYNAPVGVTDAFKYCTALNRLTGDRDRPVRLADTTVVYWSESPTAFEGSFGDAFDPQYTSKGAEDRGTTDRVRGFLLSLRQAAGGDTLEDADVPFYVLGLSPNAARVSVRFWLVGTVQEFAVRLGQHLVDLELAGGPPSTPPSTLQHILDQTARERDDIQPLLEGATMRAVLTGGRYPASLLAAVLRRVRADGQTDGVNGHIRASIVKAYLVRDARLNAQQETIGMSLDPECPHMPYHLGRLFAVLEKVQEEALGHDLNVTIKDRFFSSASANPVAAFPRLLRLHAHHLDKLTADKQGLKVVREKLVQEICARIDARKGFPTHLPLDQQGQFFIGYYHQRQDLFTKKTDSNNTTSREDN
jgi:CRISPR-associated protein Csd1